MQVRMPLEQRGGALPGPAPVVACRSVERLLGAEKVEPVEARRERRERPAPSDLRPGRVVMQLRLVGDVLADALVTAAEQTDDRRRTGPLAKLHLEPFELGRFDLDR